MADRERRFFLVERYVPSMRTGSIGPAVRRLDQGSSEAAVRHLCSLLVRDEETCLSIFEAADAGAVEAANERASFQLDRIVEVDLFPAPAPRER